MENTGIGESFIGILARKEKGQKRDLINNGKYEREGKTDQGAYKWSDLTDADTGANVSYWPSEDEKIPSAS
ncbi:hypothetical protein Y1Q_0003123 [Alligator mississippiensis]|uniref:Uncharacterized protein n=1 Tax=Alligator mississippiensis TaxID=8496 RepID=A0A151MDL3_ALLMI|nr:hypothetical protein Y1Q_0003123 [Alligator mississippiensis]